jgi:hypothetical protein
MKLTGSLLVAMTLVLPLSAGAQTNSVDRGLKGLVSTGIVVEDLDDEEARKCNISEASLDAAIRLPLSASRLTVDSSSSAYAYVNVTVLRVESGLCVASVRVQLSRWVEEFRTTAVVWDRGRLMGGSPATFESRVLNGVEGSTKLLIAAWLKANQP